MADAPIIKWKTRPWTDVIERVECERESKSSLWILEKWRPGKMEVRMCRKNSSDTIYHDTWEEAHAYLLDRADKELARARRTAARAKENYERRLRMTKPAEPDSAAHTREAGD